MTKLGKLLVLSGPTAVGKGTVIKQLLSEHPEIALSISATTRTARPDEVDGINYFFISEAEFDQLIADDALLEWATVHKKYRYGTPKAPVLKQLRNSKNVLLEIDIQGAFLVKKSYPDALLVFLLPPSWEELVRRLQGRGTESLDEQTRRLETAKAELAVADKFDYQIINAEVAQAAADIVQLL